jgi:mannose-6-phosphate isomerase-like protein (cupin superfamily)
MTKESRLSKVSLQEKFGLITEHWRPKVVASLNGQEVKLVKFCGTFPWHVHANEDELFLVWSGSMKIEFRDQVIELEAGELCVVPRGVEHRTVASTEAEVLIFEPAAQGILETSSTRPIQRQMALAFENAQSYLSL